MFCTYTCKYVQKTKRESAHTSVCVCVCKTNKGDLRYFLLSRDTYFNPYMYSCVLLKQNKKSTTVLQDLLNKESVKFSQILISRSIRKKTHLYSVKWRIASLAHSKSLGRLKFLPFLDTLYVTNFFIKLSNMGLPK